MPISTAASARARCAEAREKLEIVVVTLRPAEMRTLLEACARSDVFDCDLRVVSPEEWMATESQSARALLILDQATAAGFDLPGAARHPRIALVGRPLRSAREDAHRLASVLLPAGDISPAILDAALASALAAHAEAAERAAGSARREREAREGAIEAIAPIARGLAGLVDTIEHDNRTGEDGFARFSSIRTWTDDLVAVVAREQQRLARPTERAADLGAAVQQAILEVEDVCAARIATVVVSAPPDPVLAAADPDVLEDAVVLLLRSLIEREPRYRHFDILLWRANDDCRLAIVSSPMARQPGDDDSASTRGRAAVREATGADVRFLDALELFEKIGGSSEIATLGAASGSTITITLPAAPSGL